MWKKHVVSFGIKFKVNLHKKAITAGLCENMRKEMKRLVAAQ